MLYGVENWFGFLSVLVVGLVPASQEGGLKGAIQESLVGIP